MIIGKRRQNTHRRLTCVICHRWRVRFNCSSTPANLFMFRPPIYFAMPCFGRIYDSDYSQNLEVYFQGDYDSHLRTREMEPTPHPRVIRVADLVDRRTWCSEGPSPSPSLFRTLLYGSGSWQRCPLGHRGRREQI